MVVETSPGAAAEARASGTHHAGGRVVMVLPRGEAIRNFVYSGVTEELDARIGATLLSVKPNEELFGWMAETHSQVMELSAVREHAVVGYLRELLDTAHGRFLWSEAAKERWMLRDAEATTPAKKLKRLGKKLLILPFASQGGLKLLSGMERAAARRLRTTDEYLELFRQLRPSLVFNGSHVHSNNAVQPVQAAQWLGIPTATFIFSWDNLTSQGRVIPAYDYYLVWSEEIRQQLLGIYPFVRPEQVIVTGTPQFDFHFQDRFYWSRDQFCERVGADPARPIVLYSTGMANHMPGEPRVVEGIADALARLTDLGSPQLLVRVYPKDQTGRFEELKRRRADILFQKVPWEPNWLTPTLEDLYLFTNTVRHAAAGINIASTVSLELCMLDRPTINVGYNPPGMDIRPVDFTRYYQFDHYRPVIESGAIDLVRAEEDVERALRDALTRPEGRRRERKALIQRMFGDTLDGGSGSRVAGVLLDLAQRGPSGRSGEGRG